MRTLAGNHKLPDNPTWIEFTKTDGDEARWPRNTEPIVDNEGHVNFNDPCALDQSITISWRKTVGMEVAKKLNKPSGPSYVLKDWPRGYRLYDHNKGPQESPRHDPYLYGSVNVGKFRSPAEFIPHAVWLLSDTQGDDVQCECKYCSKRPQRAVSFELGLSQTRSSQRVTQAGRRIKEKKSSLATIRRVPKSVMPPKGPMSFALPEREKDLRAILGRNGTAGRRWAREGEVVWCALNSPIKCNSSIITVSEKNAILFWPGIVQEIRLRSEAVKKTEPPQSSDLDIVMADSTDQGMSETANSHVDDTSNGKNKDNDDDDVPWKVVQSILYKVKLLAVLSDCIVPDSRILPYQAYAPPDELLFELKQMKISQDDISVDNENGGGSSDMGKALKNKFAQFQPIPFDDVSVGGDGENRFLKAAGPFALAIQIASRLADYFTPTDEWKYRFNAPSGLAAPSNGVTQMDVDLEGISGTSKTPLSPAQLQDLNNRVMGLRNRDKENPIDFIETRFQGLWWGAERIWMDDLVRLKMGRHQVAPDGAQFIKKPAGLSDINNQSNDDDAETDLGAAGRGLFMQVEGLFTVNIPDGAGTRRECRMCGMLYELADEDWTGADEYAVATSDGKSSNENSLLLSSPNNGENIGPADPIRVPSQTIGTTSTLPITPPTASATAKAPSSSAPFILSSMPVTPSKPTILGSSNQPNISLNQALFHASNQQPHVDISLDAENSPIKKRSLAGPPHYEPYPLPPPPKGYKFHPILPPTHEAVLALELLSGRYYPKILEHPLVVDRVAEAIQSGQYSQNSPLWALECLTPGVHNAVDPHKWKSSRLAMAKDADATATQEIAEFWKGKILQSMQESYEENDSNQMIVEEVEQNQSDIII